MKTVKFGLRIKGTDKLLKYSKISIAEKEGTMEIYELSESGHNEWLQDDLELVRNAIKVENQWYKSSKELPLIKLAKEELEIVQITKIIRIEVCNEKLNYQDDDRYHLQKVEEAMKMLAKTTPDASKDVQVGSTNEANIFYADDIKSQKPKVETVKMTVPVGIAEKLHVGKAKVRCLKDIPKDMGSVRLKSDPVSSCFKEGKFYLAYTKNHKLFIMNDDKIPEFICNATLEKHWEDNHFFKTHFEVEEYID